MKLLLMTTNYENDDGGFQGVLKVAKKDGLAHVRRNNIPTYGSNERSIGNSVAGRCFSNACFSDI